MTRNPGDKFGQYRLIKLLGRGGMGEVWRATDADPSYTGPDFALKILHSLNDETGLSIKREIEASRRLDHECICRLLDFGSVQGEGFLAFELLDGRDLRMHLRERGRLPPQQALPILVDVLRALGHAHGRGVFHRDLKPENVRVLSSGRAKVMDFGIAKVRSVTRAVTLDLDNAPKRIGTPPYMAPEQWEGEGEEFGKIDHRTDLYAFGVMLREVLAGELPFEGSDRTLMGAHLIADPPPICKPELGLPGALEAVYRRLLAKRREDRFQSADEVERALVEAFDGLGVAASPPLAPGPRSGLVAAPAPVTPSLGETPRHAGIASAPAVPAAPPPSGAYAASPPSSQQVTAFPLPTPAPVPWAPPVASPGHPIPASSSTPTVAYAPPPAAAPGFVVGGAGPRASGGVGVPVSPAPPGGAWGPVSTSAPTTAARASYPSAPAVPGARYLLRYAAGGREHVVHVHLGARAAFGRQRRPDSQANESWATVPAFVLRYLPQEDPAMAKATRDTISRVHFEVAIAPDGATITDRSSTGTYANGVRLAKGVVTALPHETSLRIGPGPLGLDVAVFVYPETGAPEAVRFSRRGNATHHAYLLLAAAASIGSGADAAIRLDGRLGVRTLHAYLVRTADGGLGILPAPGGSVRVDGIVVPPGSCAALHPGAPVYFERAQLALEAHHPESDEPLRL